MPSIKKFNVNLLVSLEINQSINRIHWKGGRFGHMQLESFLGLVLKLFIA